MRPTKVINVRCSTGDMQELVTYATCGIYVAARARKSGMVAAKEIRPLVKAGRTESVRLSRVYGIGYSEELSGKTLQISSRQLLIFDGARF